jgi:NADH:ubiquinone reductase (H+-translocating)
VDRKRIIILGGGFGGVYAARFLEKTLRPEEADIWLINRENYFVFQPLLPEVISGSIGLLDTVSPIRRLCPRTRLFMREAQGVDIRRKLVVLAPGLRPRALELFYDYLVIATGTTTDFSGLPGLAQHALAFRTLGDALRLRNRIIQVLDEADNETDPDFRKRLLTFVVSGGGFSGVEVMAELNDFVRRVARDYRTITQEDIHCVLVHSGERILPELSGNLAEYAQKLLLRRGITIRLKQRVVGATADSAMLKDEPPIPTRTTVCTVPAGPVPLIQHFDCAKEKGRLLVNACLELRGQEGTVWALGDCASIRMNDGSPAPPTAQHAAREAMAVAANITAVIRGGFQKPFAFAGLGKLGSLGHRRAVAEVLGMRISGLPAWLLWRSVYLAKLPGFDRRLRVGLDWLTALLFPAELVQLRIETSDNISTEHFEAGEVIFQQGDVGDRLYMIQTGEVEITMNGARLTALGPGEYFGEMALLADLPRNASARAIRPTNVLAIAKGDFAKLLSSLPQFGSEMLSAASRRSIGIESDAHS